MELIFAAAAVLVLAGLLFWQHKRQQSSRSSGSGGKKSAASMEGLDTVAAWQPQATRVLTTAERKAYAALRAGLPEHMILAQVPLSRFMKVPTRNSYSEWLRRVGLMSVDLLVCDTGSQVVAAIEIRAGEGKENSKARSRHARLDRVLEAAGIPLHVWYDTAIPTPTAARNAVLGMPKDITEATLANRLATPPLIRDVPNPVEPEALVDAEISGAGLTHRDPPPSTWFDNLDSGVVPLDEAAPAPKAHALPR
jgi:hypothetical protein